MSVIYDFSVKDIDGNMRSMSEFKGQVLLIVNVASKCGFTKQYAWLEELYTKYFPQGFVVLGFPCNQFNQQEPGDEKEIKKFCSLTYAVKFPLFSKVAVNGNNEHPLYKYLKQQRGGILGTSSIKWNFTKFLINRDGDVVDRYAPITPPLAIAKNIEKLL